MRNIVTKLTLGALVCVMLLAAFAPVPAQAKSKGYGFKYSGKTFYMNDKADKLLEKLGNYDKRTKKKSCACTPFCTCACAAANRSAAL